MKKAIVAAITVLIMHTGFSQTTSSNQSTLDSISAIVIHYLQAKQVDSIYAMAGESFKSHLSAENFKSIAQNQVFPLNDFATVTYISTINSISKYKVPGSPDLQLLIGLDKANKLETFLIQTFSGN